jgi:transketolase
MEGIAEQHIVGMAAGLALEGFVPYVHTIGTFLTRRALEQVVIDVALQNLPVRLVASGGGMVYAPLGPTHQAIEDFALMRAVQGMAVFAPADGLEMSELMLELATFPGPAYIRIGKGGEPVVTPKGFLIGHARELRSGKDALIISTGVVTHEALAAADNLASQDVNVTVLHVPTIEPLDALSLLSAIAAYDVILIAEEHVPNGGLWTSVVELLARSGSCKRIFHACLPSGYAQTYGTQRDHLNSSGLHSSSLADSIITLIKEFQRG